MEKHHGEKVARRRRIYVNSATYASICTLAVESGLPMATIVGRAVERFHREMILRTHNEAWSNLLIHDPEAIEAFTNEDCLWDRTTADGLDGPYTEA